MLNLLPGAGLGFTASKEIAFGLAPVMVTGLAIPGPSTSVSGDGGRQTSSTRIVPVFDNLYSKRSHDDDEIVEILCTLFGVIE